MSTIQLERTIDNPMWDAIKDHVRPDRRFGVCVGGLNELVRWGSRHDLTSRYAWTITAPETVAFVAEYLRRSAIDPLAGSGYWAFLLAQAGVDVCASDLNPPAHDPKVNQWHREGTHLMVDQRDAVDAVTSADATRSLLLSWPPYDNPIGAEVVSAFRGDRIVYVGESWGGCCGDDRLFELLERDWAEVASHRPVQFYGIHDLVTVYDRAAFPGRAVLDQPAVAYHDEDPNAPKGG